MEHPYVCEAYHGTSRRRATRIIRSNCFTPSEDSDSNPQWLGDGVYFFENHRKWAVRYAIEVKKFTSDYAVIKSRITGSNVLDMEDPDERDFFEYIAKKIIDTCRSNGEEVHLINGKIINFIYNNIRKFDVVRSVFQWDTDASKPEADGKRWMNIPLFHTQICVREHDCISSLERVI